MDESNKELYFAKADITSVELSDNEIKGNKAKDLSLLPIVDLPMGGMKISPSEILNSLETTDIGQSALEYLEKKGLVAKLKFGEISGTERGKQVGDDIMIYLANCKDPLDAACAVIHEVTHHKEDIGECIWAETVCYVQEYKHIHNKENLSIEEIKKIIRAVKKAYQEEDYNWKKGGYKNGKRFR